MHNPDLSADSILCYCDGSCASNPGGKGGYAAIIFYNDLRSLAPNANAVVTYGFKAETTNNVMELCGVVKALEFLESQNKTENKYFDPELKKIHFYTDSQYICNGVNTWVTGWKQNNWKTVSGQPVKNQELWLQIYEYKKNLFVGAQWVKAHHINLLNNIVDGIANYSCITQSGGTYGVQMPILEKAFNQNALAFYFRHLKANAM